MMILSVIRTKYGDRFYMMLLSAFCTAMLIVRMIYTGSFTYRFMEFNLFLAWIPYFIAFVIARIPKGKFMLAKIALYFLWLLFFPNAAYMTTDIFHLPEFPDVPMWFDLMMLVSFAWCGIMLGFHSLRLVSRRISENRSSQFYVAFVFGIFFLQGIGIYLGRYLRWNSWDLIFQPARLINEFSDLLAKPVEAVSMLSLALLFAVFLSILFFYLSDTGKFFKQNRQLRS